MTEKEQIALALAAAIIQAQAAMADASPFALERAKALVLPAHAVKLYREALTVLDHG